MSATVIEMHGVTKILSGKVVISDISIAVAEGEVLAIIGPSGVGKTTLLKCINLLVPIDSGKIDFRGQTVVERDGATSQLQVKIEPSFIRRKIGMVFQEWNLWPNKTIRENVAEGPRFVLGQGRGEAFSLAEKLCDQVGLSDKLDDYPVSLSGGQKQRAAIARALAMEPEVLMLDEITSALDPSLVAEILDVISGLKNEKRTLLIATHHMEFARAVADRVIFLWEGRVHEAGPSKEIFDSPGTPELRNFLKILNRAH